MTKLPLVFLDDKIKPFNGNSHWVDNARIADFTSVLLHYKFLDGYFHRQVVRAIQEGQHYDNSVEYKKYLRVLENNPRLAIKGESARELESVNELVENHFLVVSEDYMVLVYQEQKRMEAAERASRGEPGGPGDEAAFYKAKAEAKIRGLRARRLEQQLEKLRKELQKPDHQEGEKPRRAPVSVRQKNRNLRQKKRILRQKKRNFRQNKRGMQSSTGWRLLGKLGRNWTKIPSRKR